MTTILKNSWGKHFSLTYNEKYNYGTKYLSTLVKILLVTMNFSFASDMERVHLLQHAVAGHLPDPGPVPLLPVPGV